jgi:uncharacterized membrane protein
MESKPPLYFAALHGWMRLFGDQEAALRSLSLIFWPPFALLMADLGRRICGRWALMPLALCAVSPLLIYTGVEARPYAMQLCAETLLLWLAVKWEEHPSARLGWQLAGTSFGVLALQFTGLFFVAAVIAMLGVRCRKEPRDLLRLLAPQAAAAFLFAALLLLLMPQLPGRTWGLQSSWWASPPSAVQVLSAPARLFAPVQTWKSCIDPSRPLGALVLVSTALLALLSGIGLWNSRHRAILLWAGPGVLLVVVAYSLLRANLLFERYYIGCAPVLYLAAGAGLESIQERRPRDWKVLLPATLAAQVLLLLLVPPFQRWTGYRRAIAAVLDREPGPLVLIARHWDLPPAQYYCRRVVGRVRVQSDVPATTGLPVYLLQSNSWGGNDQALRNTALSREPVYEGERVRVDRIR